MIETWGFYIFCAETAADRRPATAEQYQESFDTYMDLWTSCERLGFDGLAFAEHHFNPINLSPSPHLLVAAIAARTSTIRFTTLGSVLPLHDPRRYVEECGMLDYLTQGRFEPGIAPGAGDIEAITAGIPSAEIRPRYQSGAELLVKSLKSATVTHQDDFCALNNVTIVPAPRPTPGRAVWVTAMSESSAAWCGQLGFKMCTAWFPAERVAQLNDVYRAAATKAGNRVSPSMLGVRRRVFVADTDAEAQEKYEASVDLVKSMSGGDGFEAPDPRVLAMLSDPGDFAIGSPETVAEKLIEQCRLAGIGSVMIFPDFALFKKSDFLRSHELIAAKVAPRLRAASVGAPKREVV